MLWSEATAPTELRGHQGAIFRVRLYDHQVVTASDDRSVRLWELERETWRCSCSCRGHGSRVWDALLCGEQLVTACEDSLVRLFSRHLDGLFMVLLKGFQGAHEVKEHLKRPWMEA